MSGAGGVAGSATRWGWPTAARRRIIRILCGPDGYGYLDGTEIDYHDDQNEQGFVFRNPNAQGCGGCGGGACG